MLSSKLLKQSSINFGCLYAFGGGPFNPRKFKQYTVPREYPKNHEIRRYLEQIVELPSAPCRNLRHVNPIRESGPLPLFDGPYDMEDLMSFYQNLQPAQTTDLCYVEVEPEELMRRAPGLKYWEAVKISKSGFNPPGQVSYADLVVRMGLDIDYVPNQAFTGRQVLTNSKGQKEEVLFNVFAYEDLAKLPIGFAPTMDSTDYHWEIFLWGDIPIKPTHDFDLLVPRSWCEYELENWQYSNLMTDQFNIEEKDRKYPNERNPHARKELWQTQERLQEQLEMEQDENWAPDTKYNVYNKPTQIDENSTDIRI